MLDRKKTMKLETKASLNYTMTEEQKIAFEEIISKYDGDNMSQSDMDALKSELRAAGIKPGKDLERLMNAAGIKVPIESARARSDAIHVSDEALTALLQYPENIAIQYDIIQCIHYPFAKEDLIA